MKKFVVEDIYAKFIAEFPEQHTVLEAFMKAFNYGHIEYCLKTKKNIRNPQYSVPEFKKNIAEYRSLLDSEEASDFILTFGQEVLGYYYMLVERKKRRESVSAGRNTPYKAYLFDNFEYETPYEFSSGTPRKRNRNTKDNDGHTTSRSIGPRLRFQIFKRDNYRCCICGASPKIKDDIVLHVDHIIPWSKGGETLESNLQTLCSSCNLGKGNIFM